MTTHKVVPREMTDAMVDAVVGIDLLKMGWRAGIRELWRQGFDAAPAVQDAPPPREPTTEMLVAGWRGPAFWSERSTTPYMERAADLWRTMHDAWYAAPAVADAPRTAATPGDPANVIRPEDGGLSEYTSVAGAPPPQRIQSPKPDADGANPCPFCGAEICTSTHLCPNAPAAPQEDAPRDDVWLPLNSPEGHRAIERASILGLPIRWNSPPRAPQEDAPLPLIERMAEWLHKWPGGAPNEVWSLLSEMKRAAICGQAINGALNRDGAARSAALAEKDAEIARLRVALRSIAANGCCDRCQEAALVARRALGSEKGATE